MEYILILVIIILLVVIAYDKYKIRRISKDINIISNELRSFTEEEYCKTLLLATDNIQLRELLVQINALINYNRKEKTLRVYNENSISRMLSNVSHDLKTPLTIIVGYIEILIEDNSLSNKEREDLLLKVNARSKEVLNLINKFFTLAKLESGDKEVALKSINVTDIVKQSILSYYDILNNEEFEVEINVPDESIYSLGNEEALERVLQNIITNGYKHGGEGKYLGIFLEEDEEKVIIEVRDKGRGIRKNDIDRIFERSYIGEVSRNKEVSGSGLGLAITRMLVEKMMGTIEVESKENEKTSFKIYLGKINS